MPHHLGLLEAATAVRNGETSATALVETALARIARLQPQLNCVIRLEAEAALAAAADTDRRLARGEDVGPLAGVPLAHKDMYYRRGRVISCGSKIRRDWVADRTATVLQRLDGAGAIDLGGLNMAEFAVGPSGHNVHFGDCRNPWNPDRLPGGSSSGSGAAVAARLVYGALGSDTGGSIRIPAAMCGVVGLKPTQARVSRFGLMPLSFSYDCGGPLARTVRDAACLLGLIAGADADDPTASERPVDDYLAACSRPVRGLRLAVPRQYYYDELDEAVAAALDAAQGSFRDLGVELQPVDVPDHDVMNLLWPISMSAEAAAIHREWLQTRPDDYGPMVRRRIEVGLYQPATRYIESLNLRAQYLDDFCAAVFAEADAMLVPTVPLPAPTLAATDVGDGPALTEMVQRLSRCTRPISYLGLPALSVPCGFSPDGLPLALQLVGRPFAEATLCALGDAYQQATDWHRQQPALAAA